VPHRHAGPQQGILEGERAADQKRHEVVAPVVSDVSRFVDQFAVAVDPVGGQIGAQVGAGGGTARRLAWT
jgi:hypothetical protein